MFKKSFLILLILVILSSSIVLSASAQEYTWSLASVLPETHPVHSALVYFAEQIAKETNNRVKINIYGGGQLGQEKDYIEGIQLGTIDITKVSSAPLGQFSESLQVVSLPFIFRDLEHQHAVMRGPIGQQLMKDLEKSNFKGLAFYDAGFRNISTKVRPIRVPADLKGLKIRVMESAPLIDTINAFGATAVPMGQSEVYVALQQNVIDGWENNEPTVLSFNMQEVCKYYSYTRHTSIPDILIMRKDLFDSVPADIQEGILRAAEKSIPYQNQKWADFVGEAKKQLAEKGMIFNEVDDITQFQEIVKPIYEKYGQTIGMDLINSFAEY